MEAIVTAPLLRLIAGLLGLEVAVPDHTTLSRRSASLSLATPLAKAEGPVPP